MNRSAPSSLPEKQQGIVLLMMVIVLILVGASYFLSTQSVTNLQLQRQQITQAALKQAKQALLGYAKTRADLGVGNLAGSVQPGRYGYLPCPANNNSEGVSEGSCGNRYKNTLGWFPWKSLGMPVLKDGNGDCLLYAVSSTYKWSPDAKMLNEDSPGMMQVVDETGNIIQGATAKNRVVAIVFSAGHALAGQARINNASSECGNDASNFSAYLDAYTVSPGVVINNATVSNTVNKVDKFILLTSQDKENSINDRLLTITTDDIWPPIMQRRVFDDNNVTDTNKMRRLTEALARCLASYANDNSTHRLPFPAPLDLSGLSLDGRGGYRDSKSYTDTDVSSGSYIGHYPFTTANADSIIPIVPSATVSALFDKNFIKPGVESCNSLTLKFPVSSVKANLRVVNGMPQPLERQMWNNWKDHIFYAVSKNYAASASSTPASCGECIQATDSTGNKIKTAAVVIYSGKKLAGQIRQAPIAGIDMVAVTDSKQNPTNYIEVTSPLGNGKGDYTATTNSNDIIFCLMTDSNPVKVVSCSN